MTRYFAAYNLVAGPVVDARGPPARRGHRRRRARPPAADGLARPAHRPGRVGSDARSTGPAPARSARTRRWPMPENTTSRRLDQPRLGRRPVRGRPGRGSRGSPSGSPGSWAPGGSSPSRPCIVIVWIALNLVAWQLRWDPYPFILLNLAFSTQAAYAAPLILLAQNRQDDRDRISLEEDRAARRAHQGRHRVPGPRAGRAADRRRRGGDPRLPARRAGQAGHADQAARRGPPSRRAGATSGRQPTAQPTSAAS